MHNIGGSRDARATLRTQLLVFTHEYFFSSVMNALRCRVVPSGMHLCEKERERGSYAFLFASDRKKPSEGANRSTELRDRIKTASVLPPSVTPAVAAQEEDDVEIPDVNLNREERSFAFAVLFFLLFVVFSSSA